MERAPYKTSVPGLRGPDRAVPRCIPTGRRSIRGEHFQKSRIVTTSWDDGDYADLKLAQLLRSKGICGTFYVPINYGARPLSRSELRDLASEGFEIGAHGFSQKPLWGLRPREVTEQVQPCKRILEDILGREVGMFCYPRGRYDANVVRAVQEAGYRGGRTVRMLATRSTFSPFEMPTTLQAFPHARFTYLKNVARGRSLESLQSCLAQMPRLGSWLELGKKLFDVVLKNGGVWHLYGHSWEIEKLGLWDELGEILDYVCGRDGVRYVPNSAILQPQPIVFPSAQQI
jgi:peptidoglycan/xylan/chitin deacetylase (PgdA/CDA1 family)